MTSTDSFAGVLDLLGRVPRPPGAQPPQGATDTQFEQAATSFGLQLPTVVREWWGLCNGLIAGPGVLLGAATVNTDLDAARFQALWPGWRERSWLPVATDGTGNAYVLDASSDAANASSVYFVDSGEDPGVLAYVCASTLPVFLRFLLERELGASGWPFDAAYVRGVDPDLAGPSAAPLPWDS